MFQHASLNGSKRRSMGLHYIMAAAAVNVDIHEAGSKNCTWKIVMTSILRQWNLRAWPNGNNPAIFHQKHWLFHHFHWSKKTGGCDCDFHERCVSISSKVYPRPWSGPDGLTFSILVPQ